MSENIEYFPFCPGIPWTIRKGYLIPSLTSDQWEQAVANKNIIVLAHGGLIESFYSLTIIEALAKIKPFTSLLWAGNPDFYNIVKLQGIAGVKQSNNIGPNYPLPLFFDNENNVYINCLNNYLYKYNIMGRNPRIIKKPILNQIFNNSLLEWKSDYKPKFRINNRNKYKHWCYENKLSPTQKFITIINQSTNWTNNNTNCLNWSEKNWKELSALLRRFGIPVVVITDDTLNFYNTNALRAPMDLDLIVPLIEDSWALLSNDVDFLLMAECISDAILFSGPVKGPFDLYKNAELMQSESVIFTSNDLTPFEIYCWCEGNI